jgi:hypothetical protein
MPNTMLSKWQEKDNGAELYRIKALQARTFNWGIMSSGILRGRRSMLGNSRTDGLDPIKFNTKCPTT